METQIVSSSEGPPKPSSLRFGPRNGFGAVDVVKGGKGANLMEALEQTGMNFQVEKVPLFFEEGVQVKGCYGIRRKDTHVQLGTVGKVYKEKQNKEFFSTFQPLFDDGTLELSLAGMLDDGAITWMQAKIVGSKHIILGDDAVQAYALLSNSHNGVTSLNTGITLTRLFCQNQMPAAKKEGSIASLRHTEGADLTMLREGLRAGKENIKEVVKLSKFLITKKVRNTEALNEFTHKALNLKPKKAERDNKGKLVQPKPYRVLTEIEDLFENHEEYGKVRGTWWSAYNAVTKYLTHHSGRTPESRQKSLWFGPASNLIGKSLQAAVEMASN